MRTTERLHSARAENRVRLEKFFVLLSLCVIVLITLIAFLNSPFFAVATVQVEGTSFLAKEDVLKLADLPARVNIFRVNLESIKTRLSQDLRIQNVKVSRQFPGTVVIKIIERRPVAFLASGYGFIQIDSQGIVLAAMKSIKNMKAPMITGITINNAYIGDKVDHKSILPILTYLANLDEFSNNQLSEVYVKSPGEMIVYTLNAGYIRLAIAKNAVEKAKITNQILHEISDKKLAIEYIDLTYASPYLKLKNIN